MKTVDILQKLPKKILNEFISFSLLNLTKKGQRQNRILVAIRELIQKSLPPKIDSLIITFEGTISLAQLRKDLHEILESLLTYLAKEEISFDQISFQKQVLSAIDRYDLQDLLEVSYSKALKLVEDETINTASLHDVFLIKKFGHERNRSLKAIKEKFNNEGIIELDDIQKQLSEYCEIESIKLGLLQYKIYNSNRSFSSSYLISNKTLNKGETKNKLLHLYRILYHLVTTDSTDIEKIHFVINQLSNSENVNQFDFEIILDGLSNLLNYYTNIGVRGLENAQFQLIKVTVNRERYKNAIETSIYRNFIYFACSVKEYSWALKFSENYQSKLKKEDQDSAYSFNKARIYINMKQYEDVITILRDVEYKDITYNLNSKLMLMVSFFELDEYETLLSTIRAFKVFLRRRRNVSVARKANFTDFCDALYNILLAEENRDIKRIRKVKEIIAANPAIPNTGWLKEKLEELKL